MSVTKEGSVDIQLLWDQKCDKESVQWVADLSNDELTDLWKTSRVTRSDGFEAKCYFHGADPMHDHDDHLATLVFATLQKSKAIELKGTSAALGFTAAENITSEAERERLFKERRPLFTRAALDTLGLKSVVVAIGSAEQVPDPTNHGRIWLKDTSPFEHGVQLCATGERALLPEFNEAFNKILTETKESGRKLCLVWTAGYQTMDGFRAMHGSKDEEHDDKLSKEYIESFFSQGGQHPSETGVPVPDDDASNHRFDGEGTLRVFEHMFDRPDPIPCTAFRKESAYSIKDMKRPHYEALLATGHPCGVDAYWLATEVPKHYYESSKKLPPPFFDWHTYLKNCLDVKDPAFKEELSSRKEPPEWTEIQEYATAPPYDALVALASAGEEFTKAWDYYDPSGITETGQHRCVGIKGTSHGGLNVPKATSLLKTFTRASLLISNTEKALEAEGATSGHVDLHGYRFQMEQGANKEWTFDVFSKDEVEQQD